MTILLLLVLLLLYLLYKKLDELANLLGRETDIHEDREYFQGRTLKDWLKSLNENIYQVVKKTSVIADHYQADYPVGEKSAQHRKRENLAKIYSEFLQNTEGLAKEESEIRAKFEVYEIYDYDEDRLIDEINNGFLMEGIKRKYAKKAEEEFYKSGILEKDIEKHLAESNNKGKVKILHHDLFAPLYELIVKQEYEEGDEVEIDNVDEAESVKRYGNFVKNRAIVQNLLDLGILVRTDKGKGWGGRPKFKLVIKDLKKLRDILYEGGTSHDNNFFEERYHEGKLHRLFRKSIF